jgi:hypothetical protein
MYAVTDKLTALQTSQCMKQKVFSLYLTKIFSKRNGNALQLTLFLLAENCVRRGFNSRLFLLPVIGHSRKAISLVQNIEVRIS